MDYKTVFRCDYCSATYPTMLQASEHEASCSRRPPSSATPEEEARYQEARLARIRRNNARLEHLGLLNAPAVPRRPSPAAAAAAAINNNRGNSNNSTASSRAAANNRQQKYTNCTLYKCNNCKLLFRNASSATAHEETCTDSDNWESCSVCHVLRFRSEKQRLIHEEKCGGSGSYQFGDLPLASEEEDRVDDDNDEVVVIDLASSDDGGEEEDGEEQQPPIVRGVLVKCEQDSSGGSAGNAKPAAADVNHNDDAKPLAADRTESSSSSSNNSPTENRDNAQDDHEGWTTVWTCDYCKVAKFEREKDAIQHENQCKDNPLYKQQQLLANSSNNKPTAINTINKPNNNTASTSPQKYGPNSKKITLQSPAISANHTPSSIRLSSHSTAILQSLDVLYHPYSSAISFHCHYCKELLPKTGMKWTMSRVSEILPNMTLTHLLGDDTNSEQSTGLSLFNNNNDAVVDGSNNRGCTAVPNHVRQVLQAANVEYESTESFETFVTGYLIQNQIEVRKTDGKSLVYGPAQNVGMDKKHSPGGKKKKMDNSKTAAAAAAATLDSPSKRIKESDVYPPSLKVKIGDMGAKLQTTDEGNQFYLAPAAPLDGVPLVASFLSEESKKLPTSMQILLQQVEFFNLSSLKLPSNEKATLPIKAVGVRCQNCLSDPIGCGYIQLCSIKDLGSDLVTMSKDHLAYCKCTDDAIKSKLKYCTLDPTLTKYCRLIAKLYGLVDVKSGDDTLGGAAAAAVVWGDCETIPSGYVGSPKNIDIDFALDLADGSSSSGKELGESVSNEAVPMMTEKVGE
eukprot:scaffold18694_cov53-Cyclotella_meneghiniana.AAC.3